MNALWVDTGVKLAETEKPAANGECLVRVLHSGICNTDLEIARGYAGFQGVVGHEFVGVVEGSTSPEMVGKRVVGEINVGCGGCDDCLSGDERHCPARTVLGIKGRNGAHAEYLTLPARNLLAVPAAVSDQEAVFVEPLAAALGITERTEVTPETRVAVIGDGKLGLLCAMALKLIAPDVTLIGKHETKLKIAQKRGIETRLVDKLTDADDNRFDIVVEASGSETGFATALDLIKPRGRVVLKSTFHGNANWETWRIVVDEISVIGSRCGRFAPALDLLAERKIEVGDLIADEFHLTKGIEAFKQAETSDGLKVLLRMD